MHLERYLCCEVLFSMQKVWRDVLRLLYLASCSFVLSLEGEHKYCTNDFRGNFHIAYASRLFLSSLFVSWNKVIWNDSFCDSRSSFLDAGFGFVIRVSRLCKHKLIVLRRVTSLCLELFLLYGILFSSRVRSCVRILSLAVFAASTTFTTLWRVLNQ